MLGEHDGALRRMAASYERDPSRQQDLVQEIWLAVWQALPRFRNECSERTFVFRIAHNRGTSHVARRRLPTTETDDGVEIADAAPNPEQALSSEQEGQRLMNAVRRLPLGYRQVVTLALEDVSYAEIADVLGITESNVGARLTRARHMLRDLMR